jgi:DNA polymerase-2
VCCFGYLGFKNARFGKIESHECVTAWGREMLLRAKETVEVRGLHLLHALVDSVWVKLAPGVDVEALRLEIERDAGCSVGLEGIYKWIRYCPSKADKLSGVPGRYFGCFLDGELKLRGIATRRRDTPKYLKALQKDLLDRMARAGGLAECRAALADLEEIAADYRWRLKEGGVTADELAITFQLSREPGDYVHDTLSAVAAKQLAASGARLHAGETVRYVIASAGDKVKDWRTMPVALLTGPLEYDQKKYLELLERAASEILSGLELSPGGRNP